MSTKRPSDAVQGGDAVDDVKKTKSDEEKKAKTAIKSAKNLFPYMKKMIKSAIHKDEEEDIGEEDEEDKEEEDLDEEDEEGDEDEDEKEEDGEDEEDGEEGEAGEDEHEDKKE